jgi:3-hydroxypropanoate dehydrogenase
MADDATLDLVLRKARNHGVWLDKPVTNDQLRQIWDLARTGPTSANCSPARVLFLRSQKDKERLRPILSPTNVDKTMTAPVTALIGYDTQFYDLLPKLFPRNPDMRARFADNKAFAEINAFRNGTLQGAYFIIAARAIGLDCGAMSGFDNAMVDAEFFPDGRVKSNFLCNLGYGDSSKLPAPVPRISFEEACTLL